MFIYEVMVLFKQIRKQCYQVGAYIFLCLTFLLCSFQLNAMLKVLYPNVNGVGKQSFGYAVLNLALERSGIDYQLRISDKKVNNARIRLLIEQNKLSVSDFGSSPEYEEQLKAVYFPIDLGLNGWRIFLIHKDKRSIFSNIEHLEQLQNYVAGQGMGWSDTEILRHSGLRVVETAEIDNLFKMANRKRFDYLPLGANEVHHLLSEYKNFSSDLVVDEHLLLIYPFARLFFVNKENVVLHDAIKKGLIRAYEDGSFMDLFNSHPSNQALLQQVGLAQRKVIHIDNPYMTSAVRQIPQEYFYTMPDALSIRPNSQKSESEKFVEK